MNIRVLVSVVLCLVSSVVLGQTSGESDTQPKLTPPRLPIPSGPFGIGRIGYDWTDTSRSDRYSSDPQAHRELMVYLWYPISKKTASVRGEYWPGAKQMDALPDLQRRMRENAEGNWPLIVTGAITSHAVNSAPVAAGPKKFPVILFSHGLGDTAFGYTSLLEDMVSHGYVVASVEHTYTASAVVFSSGKIILQHRDPIPSGLSPDQRLQRMMASATTEITEGAGDLRFALNRLIELDRTSASNFLLAGRLDLNKVAAMGHSAGGAFATRACQLDERFKACVDLDGGMVPVAALPDFSDGATMKQPLLFLEAFHPESKMGGTHEQHLEYFKKREAQLQACPRGSYGVVLHSAGIVHGSFSDYSLLTAGNDEAAVHNAEHNLDLIESFIRVFLDRNFEHKKAFLLNGASAAEATVQQYGR